MGLRVCSATIWSVIAAAGAPAATSPARSRQAARSLRSIWWMSLSCRCMSTPNGASPFARAITSEKLRSTQRILDIAEFVNEVSRMFALEDVTIADAGRHSDRQVAERVGRANVGFAVPADNAGVVVGHRLTDQPGLLERGIGAGGAVFDDVEERRQREHRELCAQRRRRGSERHQRAAVGRREAGEHGDGVGKEDIEAEAVRQLDELDELHLELGDVRAGKPTLREDFRPRRSLPLEVPVIGAGKRLTAQRRADSAVYVMVSSRHVEQGSVEVKDERRRPLRWQSAPPTRLEKREPERIRSPRGTA